MEEKSRRGFTDSRARRLTANAVVVGLVAALLMLLLVSYWAAAAELGTYGWSLAAIVGGLASISAMCVVAAYRVQLATDRGYEAAEAVDSGFGSGPVEADPPPAAPSPAPAWPTPGPSAPAPAMRPAPTPKRIPAPTVMEPAVQPAPTGPPVEVTEPAHH